MTIESIAITGATGSLGRALVAALAQVSQVRRIVALSRDEVKSEQLADEFRDVPALRTPLGDVRDYARLLEIFRGCDAVIHAAALKRISQSVYSPGEMITTNVLGTMHVVRAAADVGVRTVLVVSSDKAVEATNLYGATKMSAECFAIQANTTTVPRGTRVSVARYGNVLGSRGSVVGIWRGQLTRGEPLAITDERMTRFVITLPQAAAFCLAALRDAEGGETFVPRLPAARIVDLADAVEEEGVKRGLARVGRKVWGLRPGGEKLHEQLISREEPARTWRECGAVVPPFDRMIVCPTHHSWRPAYAPPPAAEPVSSPYASDAPSRFLSVTELVEMLREVAP